MTTVNRVNLQTLNQAVAHPSSSRFHAPAESKLATFVRKFNPGIWRYALIFSDVILILVACSLAYYVRYSLQWFRAVDPASEIRFISYIPVPLALVAILMIAFFLSDVYPYRRGRSVFDEMYHISTATTGSILVVITISLFFRPQLDSRLIFLYIAIFVTLLLGASRSVIEAILRHLYRCDVGVQHVLLVGAGDVGRMVMRNIVARPELGYRLVGFLDDHPAKGSTDIGRFRALGAVSNLEAILQGDSVQRVIICLPWQSHRTTQHLLRICEQESVHAQVVPDLFHLTKSQMEVEDLNGIPLISTVGVSIRGWNLVLKRVSDLTLTVIGGLLSLPLTVLIAVAIWLDSPGPIFYSQPRIGKNGKPFRCYKFRSMVQDAEERRSDLSELNEASGPLFKVRNDPRCTSVGRLIRRFSLDELPQLYNVLRGEMSLVGPRPNLPEEVAQYEEWHKKRLSVSPGITGLWQVSGRSDLTFDEMVLLDLYYVENWSLTMDLGILLRSIPAVLRGRGAY